MIRSVVMDKDNNWHKLVMSLWKDIDPGVRNKIFENFIINGCLLGYQRQKENKEKYNCNIPWAILLDPTSACSGPPLGEISWRLRFLRQMPESS